MSIADNLNISNEEIEVLLNKYNQKFPNAQKHFDTNRINIIKNLTNQSFHAVAGSGKTTLIAFKLALLLQKWSYKNQGICVLSHTNVAKNIIIEELKKINSNYSLERKPHFIGTIQQFVDTFFAIPYINSTIAPVKQVDSSMYWQILEKKFGYWDKEHMQQRHIFFLRFIKLLEGSVDKYIKALNYKKEKAIEKGKFDFSNYKSRYIKLKKELEKDGIWSYEKMYEVANQLSTRYPNILNVIKYKFPIVIIDEVQDTNCQQYEFLEKCFTNTDNVIFQKIGDPDQAIYNFTSSKEDDTVISKIFQNKDNIQILDSYRFGTNIAEESSKYTISKSKLLGLSNKQCEVKEIPFPIDNPIFAIEEFVKYICQNKNVLPKNPVVKIIGAQGINKDSKALDIHSYIEPFNKTIIGFKFYTTNIICALKYIYDHQDGDFNNNYEILIRCLAHSAKIQNKTCSSTEFINYLKNNNKIKILNNIIHKWMFIRCPINKEALKLDLACLNELSFDYEQLYSDKNIKNSNKQENQIILNGNKYSFIDNSFYIENIRFEVNTIHGVKGETHDATLVLATQDKIISAQEKNITNIEKLRELKDCTKYKSQRKKIYVATSRAKYILALAIPQR